MGIQFGGDKAWKVFAKGDIIIAFHWVNGEPSMVLYPRTRHLGGSAFVIQLKMAHHYANADGYPTEEAVHRCARAALVMSMDTTKQTVHNILTAVLDLLPELIKMPPQPKALEDKGGRPAGEVKLWAGSRLVAHTEVSGAPN